jgi:hypothetical protein
MIHWHMRYCILWIFSVMVWHVYKIKIHTSWSFLLVHDNLTMRNFGLKQKNIIGIEVDIENIQKEIQKIHCKRTV